MSYIPADFVFNAKRMPHNELQLARAITRPWGFGG